jgi:hypothetical protein
MKRIVIAAVIVSLITVGAFPASKAKSKARSTSKTSPAAIPLAALFPAPAPETMAGGGMVTMEAPNHEVVMVRINDDGTTSHACVNDEAAARAFLSGAKSTTSPVKREQ